MEPGEYRNMGFDRRAFLNGAGAVLGCTLGGAAVAAAEEGRGGRAPVTLKEWEAMIRGDTANSFTCVQTAEAAEGPFYYESSLERRAIAERHPGEPLRLGITLAGITPGGRCIPLSGAVLDIWQTNTTGLYSNVGADLQQVDTIGQTFLRGHQFTDDKGYAEFETIVPGWELLAAPAPVNVAIRTTHIHVKAFHRRAVLTTQLYFPDELIDTLYAGVEPYSSNRLLTAPGLTRHYERIRNGQDLFYRASGSQPMSVERVNGILTAKATIGMISQGRPSPATLFR
jgi:protocatechuate 3,4-dioxygenase beta subunit